MKRSTFFASASAALTLVAGTAGAGEVRTPDEDCEVIRIGKDGNESRSKADANPGNGSAGAASAASGSRSISSSAAVSVSSSSRGSGASRASATSSSTDAEGRTITTRRDETGCTITVDERGITGE